MIRKVWVERIPGVFAGLYEKASRMVKESYYSGVAEKIVSFLQEGRILDLGTGPGYLPIEIARRSSSLKIVGLDLSPRLIEMARDNALRSGFSDRIQFQTGNASQLLFQDESFDMVVSTGMLHMVKDPAKVLKECHRLLKPGGEAWIFDPARVSSGVDKEKWLALLTFREKMAYHLFNLFRRINPGHTYHRREVEKILLQTPFRDYRIEEEGNEIHLRLKK